MKKNIVLVFILFNFSVAHAQGAKDLTEMFYNRMIRSAGKVLSYGDPALENHALDLALLPGKKNIVIEDRYGISILNISNNLRVASWTFSNKPEWNGMMSTYSGITSVLYQNKIYILWGAAATLNHRSAIMIAEWDGLTISNVSAINLETRPPAKIALPNQVITNMENSDLYIYAVLNGNDQLVKYRFEDRKIIYAVPTGSAPYGIKIIHNKAYITNWAGPQVEDTTKENAGIPWGRVYTDPVTGATLQGSLSIVDISTGAMHKEIVLGTHSNSIISSPDNRFLYITNSNNDQVSVIDVEKENVIDSIQVGLFSGQSMQYNGSSPNALNIDASGTRLYVANGLDNAIAVIRLGKTISSKGRGTTSIEGYIPTEAYPSGILLHGTFMYVTNLEAKGANVLSGATDIKQTDDKLIKAYTVHKQMASVSIITIPGKKQLIEYTNSVKKLSLFYRAALASQKPRKNVEPKPVPERIGEPSLFKHVIYIIKENKTYDQVFGDIRKGRGDSRLCIFGDSITPNQHKLATDFCLLDNYYASGKSSAEGHLWTDASMVSDWVEKNVRGWFRSYPHRLEDALVYNKNGFIWNNAMDHQKKVRIYGEACTTHFDGKMNWNNIYEKYVGNVNMFLHNTSTIARIRPIISPDYPDCDNFNFTDQLRADVFIKEWKAFEEIPGDQLPQLMVLSLPNDHTAGTSPNFPIPAAMVADNDLALGRIVETIASSRFWDSTIIFVTQDDTQTGWDHISSYRTTGLVISPYTKRNQVIHTDYNQTSIVRTIEQILGLPPMNIIDATAQPMFDCFQSKKTDYHFNLCPNKVRLNEMNKPLSKLTGKASYFSRMSQTIAFKEIDSGNDNLMNRILWFSAKGNIPYPQIKFQHLPSQK